MKIKMLPFEKLQEPHERVQKLPSAKKPGLQTWWRTDYRKCSCKPKTKCQKNKLFIRDKIFVHIINEKNRKKWIKGI